MTDWGKLKHHAGSAKSVPTLAKRLLDADPEKVNDAYQALHEVLVGEEKWCAAAGPALELLFAQLPRVKTEIGVVLKLIADIVSAPHENVFRRKAKRPPKKLIQVVEKNLAVLEALAAAKDPNARAGAAQVAATVPELADRTRPMLLGLIGDREPTVRMSALLALAAVGAEGDLAKIRAAAGDKHAGVRGAATLAELNIDDGIRIADRQDGVAGWLSFERPAWSKSGPQFLWFAVHGGANLLKPLLDIAEHRGEVDDVLGALIDHPGAAEPAASELVLERGGFVKAFSPFPHEGYVALLDELDKKQRALAERLADSTLVPIGMFGLAACGAPRRRWLGVEAPGPSDVTAEVMVGKKRFKGPCWRAAQELVRANASPWGVYPKQLEDVHHGLDRWEFMVHNGALSYGGKGIGFAEAEAELALVEKEPQLLARAEAIAEDLARRFRAAQAYDKLAGRLVRKRLDAQAAALLLLPFVRKKRPWPEAWDVMLSRDKNDLTRAIGEALPASRRKALEK